jgi:hypothetical protein
MAEPVIGQTGNGHSPKTPNTQRSLIDHERDREWNMSDRRIVMQTMNTSKAAGGPVGPKNGGPQKTGLRAAVVAVVLLIAFAVGGQTAFGADVHDQLRLTGVIKSIDGVTGMVLVDVTSSSCRGMRTFRASKPDILDDYIGKRIAFFIDSNRCDIKEVYTILLERGIRK